MADFYTVDRLGSLTTGATLEWRTFTNITPAELQTHVNLSYPNGVSRHGNWYFLTQPKQSNAVNEIIELLTEYVRRAHFPERPSRFQSWFGTESIEAARAFRAEFRSGSGSIWRVRANGSFRADMRCLTLNGSNLVRSWRAHQYWAGLPSGPNPFWEVLMTPPIFVQELVEASAQQAAQADAVR